MRYEGRQIDNVRVSLVDDPLVTELIDVAERYFEATNRGALADYYGPMNDIIRKDPQLREFHRRKEQLEIKIVFKYFFSKTR